MGLAPSAVDSQRVPQTFFSVRLGRNFVKMLHLSVDNDKKTIIKRFDCDENKNRVNVIFCNIVKDKIQSIRTAWNMKNPTGLCSAHAFALRCAVPSY